MNQLPSKLRSLLARALCHNPTNKLWDRPADLIRSCPAPRGLGFGGCLSGCHQHVHAEYDSEARSRDEMSPLVQAKITIVSEISHTEEAAP